PVASYLVEDSVGNYTLTSRKASDGLTYYEAQDTSISAAQQAANKAIMDQQQDITDFESQFNGSFPVVSDRLAGGTTPPPFRRGNADDDHIRRRANRHRHPLPREHAPVVGRPRERGELQHDLLQGGPRHGRRVPVRREEGRDRGGRPGHRRGPTGLHQQ